MQSIDRFSRFLETQRGRVFYAVGMTCFAMICFATDRRVDLPNILMGFAALLSIATLFFTPGWGRRIIERYRARKRDTEGPQGS